MQLKKFIYAIVFGIALSGCNESFSGLDYIKPIDPDDPPSEITTDRVPIMTAVHDPFYMTVSRGFGALEDDNWQKERATFYVYAFLANNYKYKGAVDYTAKYVAENANQTQPMYCLVDGKDGKGAPTYIHENNMLAFKENSDFFYSQNFQDYKYNFFTYHIDNAKVKGNKPVREQDRIYMDIKIDGTQDIISGIARPTQKQMDECSINFGGEEDKWFLSNILNGELLYSTMSGHRKFFPVFDVKHELSYFTFNMRGDAAMSVPIRIKDIYIKAHTDWRFTVAADNLDEVGISLPEGMTEKMEDLHLCDEVEPGVSLDGTKNWMDAAGIVLTNEDTEYRPIGSGMLLPPRDRYDLYIVCESETQDGKIRSYKARYNLQLEEGQSFEPGTLYNISMHVFGYQQIDMYLGSMKWKLAGEIIIDEDDILDIE